MAGEKRFVKVYSDGAFGSNEIWVDRETGVNYLFHAAGYAGGLTVLFRYFGLYPEGVTYAILLMNALVWVIDYYTPIRRFGTVKGGADQ